MVDIELIKIISETPLNILLVFLLYRCLTLKIPKMPVAAPIYLPEVR